MKNVFEELQTRGFIKQLTHEKEIPEKLNSDKVTFYIGFDPTADSLHVGSLLPIMAMKHMQNYGHRPIAIVGGGTGLIGDPSGKSELRQMLTEKLIDHNLNCIKNQLSRYIDFGEDKALMLNNADWLTKLSYVEFLREIGQHFSVNRMLTAECFKVRMDRDEGLTFLEFNYMIFQAYDFLVLNRKYNCTFQLGGDDQWSNILAGADLIRRKEGKIGFGLTLPLLTTASGNKMGKTEKGAVWLDKEKTTPYDFYQYWRNVDDRDVERFLKLYTLLSLEKINELAQLKDKEINTAKKILAYEVTKLAHGEEEANSAEKAAKELFEKKQSFDAESVPNSEILNSELEKGLFLPNLLKEIGLTKSSSDARRLLQGGGVYINEKKITDTKYNVTTSDIKDNAIMLRAGKKKYHRLIIK